MISAARTILYSLTDLIIFHLSQGPFQRLEPARRCISDVCFLNPADPLVCPSHACCNQLSNRSKREERTDEALTKFRIILKVLPMTNHG